MFDWTAPIIPVMKTDNTISICGGYMITINTEGNIDRNPLSLTDYLFTEPGGG